jgi:excisionase family DNA binding protein
MKTPSERNGWAVPGLIAAGEGLGALVARDNPLRENECHSERIISLVEYPDVGRVEEDAAVLRCSKWCIYDLITTGALKSIRLGRAIRVTRRALEEFLGV